MRLTISQGLAASDVSHVRQADDLVRLADRALYQAKEDGRNTIRTVEDLMIKTPLKGAVHA
ncbi:MAG: diguanylate cyclase [Deltaproteobacteria bacterium]|nr:diguanylate cyclase [Deltaproteobacteria bacterium]